MSAGGQSASSAGSQSGQQSGQTAFQNDGTQSGASASQTSSSSTPLTTGIYNNASGNAAALAGTGGLTTDQQYATDVMKGHVQTQPMGYALQGNNNTAQSLIDNLMGGSIPQVGTSSVGTSQVGAPTAASMMDPYRGAYASDVLNPSMAAFDNSTAMADNRVRASRDAGSAFGDRAAVADAVRDSQNATARGALAGQITGQGYGMALQGGAGDAGNSLSASNANAGFGLASSQANAANTLQSSLANAANYLTGNNQIMSALGLKSSNDIATDTMGRDNASALYGMSGGGVNSLLNIAGSQVPAFGTSSTGNASGATSGATSNSGIGAMTGQSSGNNSGNTSSKGGGIG